MKNYCLLSIKRINHKIPQIILGFCIIAVLLGGFVVLLTKLLYHDKNAISIQVAVVSEEENELTKIALDYLKNMDTLKDSTEFLELDYEDAFARLEKQSVDVVVYLPGGLIQGILDGTNVPVQIYLPKSTGLQATLLKEMTDAGAQMLTVAQAEIYGNYDVVKKYGLEEQLRSMEQEIDFYNLSFALDRLRLFDEHNLSAMEQLDTLQFYILSGLILLLFFFGMCMGDYVLGEPEAFQTQMKRAGVGSISRHVIKVSILWFYMSILLLIVIFRTRNYFPSLGAYILSSILIAGMLVGFDFCIYEIVGKESVGMFVIFCITVMMAFCSGMLIPAVFMPTTLLSIGNYMPTTFLRQMLLGIMQDGIPKNLWATNIMKILISGVFIHCATLGIVALKANGGK